MLEVHVALRSVQPHVDLGVLGLKIRQTGDEPANGKGGVELNGQHVLPLRGEQQRRAVRQAVEGFAEHWVIGAPCTRQLHRAAVARKQLQPQVLL